MIVTRLECNAHKFETYQAAHNTMRKDIPSIRDAKQRQGVVRKALADAHNMDVGGQRFAKSSGHMGLSAHVVSHKDFTPALEEFDDEADEEAAATAAEGADLVFDESPGTVSGRGVCMGRMMGGNGAVKKAVTSCGKDSNKPMNYQLTNQTG